MSRVDQRNGIGRALALAAMFSLSLVIGCSNAPQYFHADERPLLDRKFVEYPSGFVLRTVARGITAGSSIAFVTDEGEYRGAMLVAENGKGGLPRIYGWKADGSYFNVYPKSRGLPFLDFLPHPHEIYGPIGGMVVTQGRVFITHRDAHARGVVTSLGFDGSATTVVADLPAQGDYGMTDIAVHPTSGRLFFGVGAATNSGVVGIDNWQIGWVDKNSDFNDLPGTDLKLLGFKFFTKNPRAGIFGGDDNVETGPYQAFAKNSQLRIPKAPNGKPTAAIYSISPAGGDLRVEAHGVRYPRGLAFYTEYFTLFATNNGMELRGTRPVRDDPDALLKVIPGTWYGWPDFSTNLMPISDPRFLPGADVMRKTGYPELSFVIDHAASGVANPANYRDTLLFGLFPWQSGAAKFDFVPATSSFRDFRGSALVALAGDRGPFATGGQSLRTAVGSKVVRVDIDSKRVETFIQNTEGVPLSELRRSGEALERPIDVKFGPDGKMYILDYGRAEVRNGKERITERSGRIFVLEPIAPKAE